MPDTGAPWNIPYVASTDLVSDWPTDSLALANAIDAGLDAANIGIGTNVVQTVKTDTFTTTSTSAVTITGLTAAITPSTNTAKVLVIAQVAVSATTAASNDSIVITLAGGNTAGYIGDAAGNRSRGAAAIQDRGSIHDNVLQQTIVYLDSPATASSVTYSVEALSTQGAVVTVNRAAIDVDNIDYARVVSSLTVMEVSA